MGFCAICVVLATVAAPQVRDVGVRPSAILRGGVVSASDGTPLRRALVVLRSAGDTRRTISDARGRFEFRDVRSGRYTLSASKGGYVTIQYGARQPNDSGRSIEVLDGQVIDALVVSLPHASAIAGRIVDEFGDPATETPVLAQRDEFVEGRRKLVVAGHATTNDFGDYRIYGLPPGDYFISATVRPESGDDGVTDSPAGNSYAPTFFPGSTDAAAAQRITLALAQEQTAVNFALTVARTARITGTAQDPDGQPLSDGVVLLTRRDADLAFRGVSAAQVDVDGGFAFVDVTPGNYEIVARTVGSGEPLFAIDSITVAGRNIEGIVLAATPGADVTGQILFDRGAKPRFAPGSLRVTARPPGGEEGPMAFAPPARVNDDWTFQLRSLAGRQLFGVAGLPADWSLKAVLFGGSDTIDSGTEFSRDQSVSGLEIVVSDRVTDVHGTVVDRNAPANDYTVIVFADDRRLWTPSTRFVRMARPDQNGVFQIRGLPPGAYLAPAVAADEQGRWSDPDFLDRLKPGNSRRRVSAASHKPRARNREGLRGADGIAR